MSNIISRNATLILAIVFLTSTTQLLAQDKQWTNGLGGAFHDPSNWDSGVPGETDNALFNLNLTYGIDLTSDSDIRSWQQTDGDIELFGGHSLQTTQDSTINSGSLSISGADTAWNHSGTFLSVENGSLAINTGAFVRSNLSFLGTNDGHGRATVNGANSHWQVSSVNIANSGSGELRIENGGKVTGSGFIGRFGNGSATVTGTGSLWENGPSGDVFVGWGSGGQGEFTITDGGQVIGRAGAIGSEIGSTGHVTVTGTGSRWTTTLQLLIGSSGNGSLSIEDGGLVLNQSATLASTNRGTANVVVTGTDSHWQVENALRVGSFGYGELTIRDGAQVTVGVNGFAGLTQIGETSKIELDAGRFEFGTISFESLGRICGTSGSLAGTTESINRFNHVNSFDLTNLRDLETTDVRIANSGVIHGTGVTNFGIENHTDGELRVLETDSMIVEGHSFNSGEINNFGGVLKFGKSLTNRSDGFIGGRGQFSTDEGLLNEGVMAFTGGVVEILGEVELAAGGQVITSGGAITTFFDDVVHNGAEIRTAAGSRTIFLSELSGNGPFSGNGELLVAGELRPGNSPGILDFAGDLTLSNTAESFFEIGGTNEGQFDRLVVGGNLHLDGLLSIDLIDGFDLSVGNEFLLADVTGILTGRFSGFAEGDRVARLSGLELLISYSAGDGNDVGLLAAAIPEPGYLFLLLISVPFLGRRRRSTADCQIFDVQ